MIKNKTYIIGKAEYMVNENGDIRILSLGAPIVNVEDLRSLLSEIDKDEDLRSLLSEIDKDEEDESLY